MTTKDCPLCNPKNEEVIFNNDLFRLVYVRDENYPGYLRLILNKHVKEMSELTVAETKEVISALLKCEKALIDVLDPTKINWAQIGNIVPHLHWHLIPRFDDDPTFPDPIWSEPKREVPEDVKKKRADLAEKAVKRIKDTFFKSATTAPESSTPESSTPESTSPTNSADSSSS